MAKPSSLWQFDAQRISAVLRRPSAFWVLMLVLASFVMIGHQSLAPIDRDEARFSQASKQMVMTKDFVTIKFQDEYRAKKPAGIYWMQAASAALFGPDDIANYRLPSLAGYLASFALIFAFARMMNLNGWGGLAPLLAAFMLASNFIVFAEAHLAKTDSVLLACIIWQQLSLFDMYRRRFDGQAGAPINQFWMAMGLAILIKGPIGPLVGFSTLVLLCLFDRSVMFARQLRWLRGLLIVLVIVAPWAVSVQIATQGAFLDIAIKADFLAKVQSAQESHGAPFGTYLLLLPLLAFPASFFASQIAMLGRDVFKRDKGRFLIAWIIGYWLLIELTPTKLPHYVLPILPALWLLVMMCFAYPARPVKWRVRVSYAVIAISGLWGISFALLLAWLALRYGGVGSGVAFMSSLVVILLTAALLYGQWRWMTSPQSALMAVILGVGALLHLLTFSAVIANARYIHPSTELAATIEQFSVPTDMIAAAGYHEPSMVFLLSKDVLLVDETEAALLLAEAPAGLAIIEERKKAVFLDVAQKIQLDVAEYGRVDGFNISKGQEITLLLYRRADLS